MCLRCLFGLPLQFVYTPSSGYRVWMPDMPAGGAGATLEEAFDAFADDLVLWTDWLDEQYPHSYCAGTPLVDPRVLWALLRPHLRSQLGEPVAPEPRPTERTLRAHLSPA